MKSDMKLETDGDFMEAARDMKFRQYLVLKTLCSGPKTMSLLSEAAQASTASITLMRDNMVRHGLVEDTDDPEVDKSKRDRRKVFVAVTQTGRRVVDACEKVMREAMSQNE
jgi:DNA-binding MarR family transcriptional regulator